MRLSIVGVLGLLIFNFAQADFPVGTCYRCTSHATAAKNTFEYKTPWTGTWITEAMAKKQSLFTCTLTGNKCALDGCEVLQVSECGEAYIGHDLCSMIKTQTGWRKSCASTRSPGPRGPGRTRDPGNDNDGRGYLRIPNPGFCSGGNLRVCP